MVRLRGLGHHLRPIGAHSLADTAGRRLLAFEPHEERTLLAGTVIDHNDLVVLKALPDSAVAAVAEQRWFFAHASVGANMRSGMIDLRSLNASRYPLALSSVSYNSTELRAVNAPASTTAGTIYDCNRGNPGWESKLTVFQNSVTVSGWHDSAVDVVMDKFCYIDQAASADSYLNSMSVLEAAYPNTRFVYITMPLMTAEDSNNVLRNTYNDTVRAYCVANDKLLFDLADIEAHDPDGNAATFSYSGSTYQKLYSGYTTDGGHLNDAGNVGRQQAALGWYAMAALIEGTLGTPTDMSLSHATLAENQAVGTSVGTLTTTDRDTADTFTYTLVAGDGSDDNASFQIVGNQLQTNAILDFETQATYQVRVRVTDSQGLQYEEAFTVNVTDVNDAPTVAAPLTNVTVTEDAASTTLDLSGVFADADGDTLVYTVSPTTVTDLVDQVSEANYTHILQDLLYTHTGDNRGFGAEHDLARDNIQAYFENLGLTTTLEPFTYNNTTYYNVVATKLGTTSPDDVYLVGAHFDSVNNPGADDNASGTAAVMEIARVLASYEFDATLRFVAFDREEQGLKGSYAYAAAHASDTIRGMVNLDMIAYNPSGSMHDTVVLYDRIAGGSMKGNLAMAMATYATGISTVDAGQLWGSDHSPFEEAGFDAALIIEASYSSNPCYHQATDAVETADYLDYAFATEITRGVAGYLASAAGLVSTTDLLATHLSGTTLTLDYAAGQYGELDITVRALDPLGAWVEDTFHVTITFVATATLDIDGNGACDALTDGLLVLRYLFDPSGDWSYADALGSGATRTTREAIRDYLDGAASTVLDCDGNGACDALTDGLLFLRYLFDPPGDWNYADALGSGAMRTTREAIRAYLDNFNPDLAESSMLAAAVLAVADPSRESTTTLESTDTASVADAALVASPVSVDSTVSVADTASAPTTVAAPMASALQSVLESALERWGWAVLMTVPTRRTADQESTLFAADESTAVVDDDSPIRYTRRPASAAFDVLWSDDEWLYSPFA